MSSSVSNSLSAGAQLLANNKLLLPGPSQSDIGTATPDQGVKKAAATLPLQASGTLSISSTSPDGDTVELSAEAMQMLQQIGHVGSSSAGSSHAVHSYSAVAAHESFDYFG